MQDDILYDCGFDSILALCVAKEQEGTLCIVQNVNTGCTRGVQEFIKV